MTQIHACREQPFESRIGEDFVVLLRFRYDPDTVQSIKSFLAIHKSEYPQGKAQYPGGWLPGERAWFVEDSLWPAARRMLRESGAEIDDET